MTDDPRRAETLARLERWYNESKNPLYIWEAIAKCCTADGPETPLPLFCRTYLEQAATNMTLLSWGRDFREPRTKIEPKTAAALLAAALDIGGARKKSAFAKIGEDADAMRAVLPEGSTPADYEASKKYLKQQRSIDDDRAKRIVRYGRKMLGSWNKGEQG